MIATAPLSPQHIGFVFRHLVIALDPGVILTAMNRVGGHGVCVHTI
jgi:hypothetical protein